MEKMTEQFKGAGEKAGENYVQYLLDQMAIKDNQLENLKAINESLNNYIDNNLQEGDSLPDSFVQKTRKIMEPAFYMVFVDDLTTPILKSSDLDKCYESASMLAKQKDNEVYILAHYDTLQREIIIKSINKK
jgi:hypothetical protein